MEAHRSTAGRRDAAAAAVTPAPAAPQTAPPVAPPDAPETALPPVDAAEAAPPALPDFVDNAPLDQEDLSQTPVGRTVRNVGHGGAFVPNGTDRGPVDPATHPATLMPATELAIRRDLRDHRFDATTSFDYLFRSLRARFPRAHLGQDTEAVRQALLALGTAMIDPAGPPPSQGNSTVPAVYTYWGQFIDHDITLNTNGPDTTSAAGGDQALGDITVEPFRVFAPNTVVRSLHNGRHPMLNLDSLYGSGPRFAGEPDRGTTRSEAAYVPGSPKLRLGRVATTPIPGFRLVAPGDDAQRDLPRSGTGAPLVPDDRNDENLVVAQFHVAMIRFHNAVVDWVARTEPLLAADDRMLFDRAQQLVRFHYQWLVANDYLRTLTKPGVLDQVALSGSLLFRPFRRISMPLEFAVAAFRFGHSMVRGGYDYNLNFGPGGAQPFASLEQLFQFTDGGNMGGVGPSLPSNWPIDWARFTDKGDPNPGRGARKIDPFLARGLDNMVNLPAGLLRRLAQRNLLRGYMLAIPTGEDVARALHLEPLTPAQLRQGAPQGVSDALDALGGRTPLWYYVLKEAQVQGNGNFLGEVGSRILCETFVYLLREDRDSYVRHAGGWSPADGVRLEDGSMITTLPDLMRFAGVLPVARAADGEPVFRTDGGHRAGHDGLS